MGVARNAPKTALIALGHSASAASRATTLETLHAIPVQTTASGVTVDHAIVVFLGSRPVATNALHVTRTAKFVKILSVLTVCSGMD